MGLLNPVPGAAAFIRHNILKRGNLIGLDRTRWARGLELPREGKKLLFAGCGYQYLEMTENFLSLAQMADSLGLDWNGSWRIWEKLLGAGRFFAWGRRNPLRDTVLLLRQEGVEVAYLGEEEPCCGAPLFFCGYWEDFEERIEAIREVLLRSEEIVGMVPSCTYALKELMGLGPRVQPFPVFYLRHRRKKRRLKVPQKVVYHDPCILARYLGVVDEPREILRGIEGVELLEAESSREWANCCGGGGGFELIFPQVSSELAKKRAEELLLTGAEVIVTSCPGCLIKLQEGVKALGRKVRVVDLSEFVLGAEPCD